MAQNKEDFHRAVLLAVACNTIMLEVCDLLKETDLYKQDRKNKINLLVKDLEGAVLKFYKGISDDEEQEYYKLIRCVERAAKHLAKLVPSQIDQFSRVMVAFESGEIFEAPTERGMQGLIDRKQVKQIAVPQ